MVSVGVSSVVSSSVVVSSVVVDVSYVVVGSGSDEVVSVVLVDES